MKELTYLSLRPVQGQTNKNLKLPVKAFLTINYLLPLKAFLTIPFNFIAANEHDINESPSKIFANNEMNLSDVQVYGFDYDYTLACYTDALHRLIYDQAMENLVNQKMVSHKVTKPVQ